MDHLDYLLFMQNLSQEAGKIALHYFDHGKFSLEYKGDQSPVTQADTEIEQMLRSKIQENFPNHSILGEEYGYMGDHDADYCWVVDPIDGTKNFAAGIPCFATLIALCHKGIPVLGCISAPALHKIWTGGKEQIARCNGKPISSSKKTIIAESWFSYTAPSMFSKEQMEKIQMISTQAAVSIYGNDAIAFGLTAEGRLDLVIENQLKPWDFCTIAPVIEAAGGCVVNAQGEPLQMDSDGFVIAAGSKELALSAQAIISS